MKRVIRSTAAFASLTLVLIAVPSPAAEVGIDSSGYSSKCGVAVEIAQARLAMRWPTENGEVGRLVLDLREGKPLVDSMAIAANSEAPFRNVVQGVDPVAFVVVGERRAPAFRPPELSVFDVFFDSPASRPFQTFRSDLVMKKVRVNSHGHRATVALDGLTIGPFAGQWQITVYPGGRLVHLEAVVSTREENRAFLYDAGLVRVKAPL